MILLNENCFFTDGGCLMNNRKKEHRLMAMAVTDWEGNVLVYKTQEGGSNNIAELLAVKECMMKAILDGRKEIHIFTDSTNTVHWMRKVTNNAPEEARLIKTSINAMLPDIRVTMEWIPRDENFAGHFLSQKLKGVSVR